MTDETTASETVEPEPESEPTPATAKKAAPRKQSATRKAAEPERTDGRRLVLSPAGTVSDVFEEDVKWLVEVQGYRVIG